MKNNSQSNVIIHANIKNDDITTKNIVIAAEDTTSITTCHSSNTINGRIVKADIRAHGTPRVVVDLQRKLQATDSLAKLPMRVYGM